MVKVASTIETEPMILDITGGDTYYKKYPKIRQEDIGSDTSNKFIDTLNISNLLLSGIGGDYDGVYKTCSRYVVTYNDPGLIAKKTLELYKLQHKRKL